MNPVKPEDIRKGDVLWEDSQYGSMEFEVLCDVTHVDGKWEWTARTYNDPSCHYLITDGYEHYGPSIVKEPGYFHQYPLNYKEEDDEKPR